MEEKLLATASIGRTHGWEGFVRIHPYSGETSHLERLESCVIVRRDSRRLEVSVKDFSRHADAFLMRFSGYESKEKAQILSGGIMYIPRSLGPQLEEGEYYIADLYGLRVMHGGEECGIVKEVSEGAQAMLLQVERNGRIYIVPNLPVFVSKPDFRSGTIELLMGELVDL